MFYKLPKHYVPLLKFGRIPDIDAADTNEEVWDGGGAYSFPSSAQTMTVSSSSTDDAAAGTGAQTVCVHGLNSSWEEVEQVVTLNGQTGVTLTTDLLRVFRAHVVTTGSGDVNAGNVWVGTGTITSGVPANKYAGILAGIGQTLMAVYTTPVQLPDGTNLNGGRILRWYASIGAVQSAFATVALQTKEDGSGWRTRRVANISEGSFMDDTLFGGVSVPTKTDIRVRVLTNGANNSSISAGFEIALMQDVANA